MLIYAGNKKGDVYIYRVDNIEEALKSDTEKPLVKPALELVDIIKTGEDFDVRDVV